VVNVAKVTKSLGRLTLMKYFPADDSARAALVELVCGMIDSDEQAEWLAKRMLQVYPEWPGPQELRACFCGRYRPKDGINAYSAIYPDGLPPDPTAPPRGIEAPSRRALPAACEVTADAVLDQQVAEVAQKRKLPAAPVKINTPFAKTLLQVATPPHLRKEETPQVITQADIDAAVAEIRVKKAQVAE